MEEEQQKNQRQAKALTGNDLGRSHQLLGHLLLACSCNSCKLLFAIRSFPLKAFLGRGCVSQLLLQALLHPNGIQSLLLRSPKDLFEIMKVAKGCVIFIWKN